MSSPISQRLREMVALGEQRRQRGSEIQEQVAILSDTLQRLRMERECYLTSSSDGPHGNVSMSADLPERRNVLDQDASSARKDILDTVQSFLSALDMREQEFWNEDDDRILYHLGEVWAAAERRGYTAQELQEILRSLYPPK